MKKINYLQILIVLIAFSICNNVNAQSEESPQKAITIGHIDKVSSKILGHSREFLVHVPQGASFIESTSKYPVLYLLDGDAHFLSLVSMLQQLGDSRIPQMIIVGITAVDRTNEMTPTHVDVSRGDSTWVKTSGGGERFTEFLEKELIPYVDSKYPTTPFRTFVGHSFGGLLVVNTLMNHPDLFNYYLSIDPSLWWDDGLLVHQAKETLAKEKFDNKSLFVAVANTMDQVSKDFDLSNVEKDTTEMTSHIRSILEFNKIAETNAKNGLAFEWKYYPKENHGTIPFISTYDALNAMFSWYQMEDIAAFNDPDMSLEASMDFIKSHYEKLSKHFGYTEIPSEDLLNNIGYAFMNTQPEKAHAFLEMNIKYYPESANVYDSMGDYYVAQSNKAKAIEYFTKAYEMGGSSFTKTKLEELKEAKED